MHRTVEEIANHYLAGREAGERERRIFESAIRRQAVSRDLSAADKTSGVGNRLADAIARVGGSWSFILGFLVFLAVWVVANAVLLGAETFDPYPFVFLNLVLSMLAAIQAPIIMMSQNRQAARDRRDAEHDYEVNLKAEIEIMALHEKMDMLRQKEIVAMHATVEQIAKRMESLEKQLAGSH
ncbi:MAG: DUF1003 domain-containing protein [Rhizobiaceae bacterium]|nr:DUF1003 domain-containing protein [Rhizobiaceae bacterium]